MTNNKNSKLDAQEAKRRQQQSKRDKARARRFLDGINVSVGGASGGAISSGGVTGGSSMFGVQRGTRSVQAPTSVSFMSKPTPSLKFGSGKSRYGPTLIVSGRDFLTTIGTAGKVSGDVLYQTEISPAALPATRLQQFSNLYSKYKIKKLKFLFQTASATTTSGALTHFIEYDPLQYLPSNQPVNVNLAAAHITTETFAYWESSCLEYIPAANDVELYTSPQGIDLRTDTAGRYTVIDNVHNGVTTVGDVFVEYEIEFFMPQVGTNAVAPGAAFCVESASSGRTIELPFGSSGFVYNYNSLSLIMGVKSDSTANKLQFPVQSGSELYFVFLWVTYSATTGGTPDYITIVSTDFNTLKTTTSSNATTATYYAELSPKITASSWNLEISTNFSSATIAAAELYVFPIPVATANFDRARQMKRVLAAAPRLSDLVGRLDALEGMLDHLELIPNKSDSEFVKLGDACTCAATQYKQCPVHHIQITRK